MNKLLDYLSNLGTASATVGANEIVLNDPKLQEQYLADAQQRQAESAQRFRKAALEDEYRKSGNYNPVEGASNNVIGAWEDNATAPNYYAGNSLMEDLGDGALAVGKGIANTVLGGARAFASGEDSWINKGLDGISSGLGGMQSEMMQARVQDQQRVAQEANDYWDRQVSLGTVSAGDAEIGKFKDNWSSQNSSSVWDNIGQAVGSLIPIMLGGYAGAGLAIGSSFSEVNKTIYDEVYKKDASGNFEVSHNDLMQDKIYANTFNKTGDEKKARDVLYQEASNSAMFSLKNVVGTGIDFAGDKLAVKGLGGVVKNIPKFGGASKIVGRTAGETVAETAGSSTRQYAAGEAMNQYGITDRDPLTGIGANAVTEVIGSIGATTAINTPGAAWDGTKATGRNAAKLAGFVGSKIGKKDADTEQATPTTPEQAEESVAATMSAAVAASEAMATEEPSEQNTSNQEFVKSMTDALSWEDVPEGAASEGVRAALNGSRDIGDALIRAGNSILSGTNDDNDAVNLALWIQDTIDETEALVESGKLKLTELPDGSPLISLVENFSNNANIIKNQDVLTKAIAAAKDYASKLDTEIDPNAEASTQQQKVDNTVTVSRLAPEKSNLDSVNYVLEQVERGESSLPDDQVAMLKVIRDTLNKQREIDQSRADQGYSDNIDIVGREVKSDLDDGKKGLSALGHADKVIAQMRKGSVDGAKTQLETFGRFVQSHLNKVNALVESREKGGSTVKYDTVGKNGKSFAKSKKGVKYDAPIFAHTVQNEAQLLVATYNGLIDAYPAIGASKLKEPSNSFTGPATKAKTETKTATERLREISEEVPTSPEEQNTDTTAMETPEEVSARVAEEEVEVEAPKTSGYQEAITRANAASRAEDTAPKKAAAYISSLVSSINAASGETKDRLIAQLEKAKARRKVAKKDPEVKAEPTQEATTAVEEVVEPTEGKSTLSTKTIKSYSDEKLNDEIDAYIGFHEKIGRTPDSEATLSALVAEMNIREDKAAAEIQAEEAAELSEDTVVEEVVTPEPVADKTEMGRREITKEGSEDVVAPWEDTPETPTVSTPQSQQPEADTTERGSQQSGEGKKSKLEDYIPQALTNGIRELVKSVSDHFAGREDADITETDPFIHQFLQETFQVDDFNNLVGILDERADANEEAIRTGGDPKPIQPKNGFSYREDNNGEYYKETPTYVISGNGPLISVEFKGDSTPFDIKGFSFLGSEITLLYEDAGKSIKIKLDPGESIVSLNTKIPKRGLRAPSRDFLENMEGKTGIAINALFNEPVNTKADKALQEIEAKVSSQKAANNAVVAEAESKSKLIENDEESDTTSEVFDEFGKTELAKMTNVREGTSKFQTDPEALSTLINMLESDTQNEDITSAYAKFIKSYKKNVDDTLDKALVFLSDKISKQKENIANKYSDNVPIKAEYNKLKAKLDDGTLTQEAFDKKFNMLVLVRVAGFAEGNIANLANYDAASNTFTLPKEIREAATASLVHWIVNLRNINRAKSHEDLAEVYGIPFETLRKNLTTEQMDKMVDGVSSGYAKNDLSRLITEMLGVTFKSSSPIGRSKGSVDSLAAELISMLENGKSQTVTIDQISISESIKPKVINLSDAFLKSKLFENMSLAKDTIAKNLTTNVPKPYYIGSAPKVSSNKLKNPVDQLTKRQQKVLEKIQGIPFKINTKMMSFLDTALDDSGLIELFGTPDIDSKVRNSNHKSSLAGQNNQITSSMRELRSMMSGAFEYTMGEAGGTISDVPFYYASNFSSVSRLQMAGSFTPQGSKLVRSVVSPNRAQVDVGNLLSKLTDGSFDSLTDNEKFYMLAQAQALGISIHNQTHDNSYKALSNLVTGRLAPVIEMLGKNLALPEKLNSKQIAMIKDALGGDLSELAVQALVELAEISNGDAKSNSDFTTHMYIEADGITNGPFMANMLLGADLTPEWITFMENGGMFIGRDENSNTYRGRSKDEGTVADNYQLTTNRAGQILPHIIMGWYNGNGANDATRTYVSHVNNLIANVFDHINIVNGDIVLTRNTGKNPLTVTIYGSGAAGIANKFTDQIRDFIHEVSSVLYEEENRGATPRQAQQIAAETMFPNLDSESALMKLDIINDSLLATSRQHMYLKGKQQIVTLGGYKDTFPVQLYSGKRKDIASLSGIAYSNISNSIEKTLVDSLRIAMGEITPSTLFTSEKLVDLTTRHSGLARALFVKKLKAVLEAKKKAAEKGTSGGRPNDFLSQKEVNDVMKELSKFGTSIDMLGQNFSLGKTGKSYIDGVRATFGASTSGQFATDRPEVTGLQDIGVGGVPRAVIGFGDAEVIMRFIELMDEHGFTDGYQQIFDGINLSANNYKEASKLANQAVQETLFNNPLDQITDAMDDAMPKLMIELGIINEDGALQDGISDWDSLSNAIGEDVVDIIYKAYHPFPNSEPVGLDEIYAINHIVVNALRQRAYKVEAVQNTLKDFKISYDQMASVGEQYVSDGKAIDSNSATDISAALLIRSVSTPESKAVVSAINTDVVFGGLVIPGVFSKLYNVLKAKIPDADKRVFAKALRDAKNSNTSIIVGDLETVLQSEGITDDVKARLASGNVNGVYDHKANRIYVVNPTAETIVHEVLHANTLSTIITYYTDPSKLSPIQIQAMQNIEALMGQFQNHGMEGKTAKEMEAINHLSDILFSFESESSPNTAKIKAVAEFIAYVGSDSDLRKAGKRTSVRKDTKLAVFLNDAWQAVKSLLGLNKDAETTVENGNLYAATMYNTNIIIGMNDNSSSSVVDMLLNHEKPNKDNRALIIRNGLINLVKSMEGKVTPEEVALKMAKMSVVSEEISSAFKGAGFSMNTEETQVFESLVEVMGLGYKLDTSAKNSINRLFNHALRNIKPESFLSNPSKATPEDIETANQKYAAITGAYTKGNNTVGRTNLVSSFLALAMSNDEFAGVLNKIGLPKNNSEKAESFDDLVGNFGNGLIHRLTNKVNNIKKGDTMVSSLESLMGALLKKPEGSQSVYKTFVAPVGQVVDKANDILSEGISRLGSKTFDYGDMLQNSNGNKFVEGLGSTLKIIGGIVDKNTSGAVAEGLSSILNKTKAPEFIKSAIFGMIGRTESNKNVYDLIKPIKAFVQKQRQMFVENTPIALNSKFKKKPTTEEAISLHKSMAKTDMASLLSVYSAEDAMRIAASDSLINRRIRDIAMQIKIADPSNEAYLHSKSEQLAEYMVNGKTGSNLRRNAKSIIIGSGSTKVSAKLVDEMVTLMALRKSDLSVLRSKMKTDKEGIRFTLSYLKGQIAEELAKDTYHQINGFKGYIPSKNEGSLVVVEDSKAEAYLSRGYVRTGDYIGSRLDSDRSKRGYYYSSLSTTRPFAQGIMQNVLLSVNGVDSTNGKAIGITTGGLVDDAHVSRVASMLDRDTTEYGLMPIFNTEGEVIGLERALDPSQVSKLDAGSNLFDMIGVWRGRQAEEYTAGRYNEVSIDELLTMYQKDKGRQDEFINVLDPKELAEDKVLKESVGLIDAATITYAKEKFGGKLMVRKDMLNDVLGYRSVSVAGVFDGNNNMSKGTNKVLRDGLSLLVGKTAFSKLVKTEEAVQGLVGDAKQLIVVKSVVVPAINGLSNLLHLKSRGVDSDRVITGLTDKLVEIETYSNLNKREVVLEAEIRAASNNIAVRRALQAELLSIRDSYKDLSIYPLLATGEFSSIVSVAIDGESTNLKKGKVAEYVEESINKMAPLQRDIAKNLFITKDTSIYQFLQKATDYGDFLAKAIYYDHLIDKGVSQEVALGKIKEEFINYDVLPGRSRGYLEKMGLLWFYNFKLRSVKVALSTMRENPVHALLSGFIPTSTVFGNTGLPMTDNIFYKMFDGSLPYSIGPGQGLNSVGLHPLVNILN